MTSHYRSLLSGLAVAVATGAICPAQSQAKAEVHCIAARNAIVNLEIGKSTRLEGIKRYVVRVDHRHDAVFDIDNLSVDAATGTQVRATNDRIIFETLTGSTKWTVDFEALKLPRQPTPPDRLLTKHRVLVKFASSIVALDREDGSVA